MDGFDDLLPPGNVLGNVPAVTAAPAQRVIELLGQVSTASVLELLQWSQHTGTLGAPSLGGWMFHELSRELARRGGHAVQPCEPMSFIPFAEAGVSLFALGAVGAIMIRERAEPLPDGPVVERFLIAIRDSIALLRPTLTTSLH